VEEPEKSKVLLIFRVSEEKERPIGSQAVEEIGTEIGDLKANWLALVIHVC
jgi:hypothetical protein